MVLLVWLSSEVSFSQLHPANMQIFGSIGWLEILSIHEYRHAQQNSNSLHGITWFLRYLMGEQGWSLGRVVSVPNWFMEGDAVWAETKFSGAGRGRVPSFTKEQRAITAAGLHYNYHKYRNGSFKNLLPSRYPTGYLMLTHLRNEKGVDVWNNILKESTSWKGIFYPFNKAMSRNTGYKSPTLLKTALNKMSTRWQVQRDTARVVSGQVVNPKRKTVTHYTFPQATASGKVLAWKKKKKKKELSKYWSHSRNPR